MEKMKHTPENTFKQEFTEFAHRGIEHIRTAIGPERTYWNWMKPGAHTGEENVTIEEFAQRHKQYLNHPNDFFVLLKNPEELTFTHVQDTEKTAWVQKKHQNLSVEHIQFPSAYAESRYQENNTVHAYHIKSPQNNTAALFIGGWARGAKEPEMNLCGALTDKGIDTLIHILPYHDERQPEESAWSGQFFISPDLYWTPHNVRHAVSEAHTLLHWLRTQNYKRVGIVGYSYGSVLSTLTYNAEAQLDFAVTGAFAANLSGVIWHNPLTRPLKMRLIELGVTQEDLQKAWMHTDPKDIALTLDPQKMLMISTTYDEILLPKYQETAWEAVKKPRRLWLPTNHMAPLALPSWRNRFVNESISFVDAQQKGS